MQVRPFLRGIRLDRERVPDFEEYPFCIPAVRALEELAFHEAVTFFVGENGTGKSTLLEAIAVACGSCPEGGGRNFQVETRATHSPLWRYLLPLRGPLSPRDGYFLRAESFYNVATAIDELDRVPAPAPFIRDAYGGSRTPVLMGRAFSPCCTTGWAEMGCICSTSRRPPCRLPGSWPCWRKCAGWLRPAASSSCPPIPPSCWRIRTAAFTSWTGQGSGRSRTRRPRPSGSPARF